MPEVHEDQLIAGVDEAVRSGDVKRMREQLRRLKRLELIGQGRPMLCAWLEGAIGEIPRDTW